MTLSATAVTVLWVVLLVLFTVIEAVTIQLVSIWFALGALGALIASFCSADIRLQLIIFLGVSIISLIATRPLVKKFTSSRIQSTNADRCIGENAIVVEEINNLLAKGQAKINGNTWTARSSDGSIIAEGSTVVVEKIEGVKLIVNKLDKE